MQYVVSWLRMESCALPERRLAWAVRAAPDAQESEGSFKHPNALLP
jgi:hypothetical protein